MENPFVIKKLPNQNRDGGIEAYLGGNKLWRYRYHYSKEEYDNLGYEYLAYRDGMVYVIDNYHVTALDADTGKVLWKGKETISATSHTFDEEGNLYVNGFDGPDLLVYSRDGDCLRCFNNDEGHYWPCIMTFDTSSEYGTLDIYYDGDGSLLKYDLYDTDFGEDIACKKLIEYYNKEWKNVSDPHYPYFANIDSDSDTELIIDGGYYEKDQFIRGMAVFDFKDGEVIERYKTTGLQNAYLVPLDDYYKMIICGDTKTKIYRNGTEYDNDYIYVSVWFDEERFYNFSQTEESFERNLKGAVRLSEVNKEFNEAITEESYPLYDYNSSEVKELIEAARDNEKKIMNITPAQVDGKLYYWAQMLPNIPDIKAESEAGMIRKYSNMDIWCMADKGMDSCVKVDTIRNDLDDELQSYDFDHTEQDMYMIGTSNQYIISLRNADSSDQYKYGIEEETPVSLNKGNEKLKFVKIDGRTYCCEEAVLDNGSLCTEEDIEITYKDGNYMQYYAEDCTEEEISTYSNYKKEKSICEAILYSKRSNKGNIF